MPRKDPRVDAYVAKAAPFAQPILKHLRTVIHETCPDVEETIKWGMPSFGYRDQMLCGMAAFKQHCAFGFWKGKLILDENGISTEAMGQFGRITRVSDLPPRTRIKGFVKQAMKLNEQGIRVPRKKAAPRPTPKTPADLSAALKKNRKALATFEQFSPSHKREYVEWIEEAKREATRAERVKTAVEWMAAGKSRMWKYRRK